MPFQVDIGLSLGPFQTGLSLKAALLDGGTGAFVAKDVSAGFIELGQGDYTFRYSNFPSGFRGVVMFYVGTVGAGTNLSTVTIKGSPVTIGAAEEALVIGAAGGAVTVSGVPVSPYIVWQEFVNRFGWMNIIKASNKDGYQLTGTGVQQIDNAKTPNYYAIQDSFNYAGEKINSELQGGMLQIPLDFTPNAGVVPIRVRRWAMVIAFCDLLNMRNPDKSVKRIRTAGGWRTESAGGDSMGSQLEEALMDIAMHKNGQWRQMPEAKHATSATPGVIDPSLFGTCRFVDGVPLFAGYLATRAMGLNPATQWGGSGGDNLNVTGSDVYKT